MNLMPYLNAKNLSICRLMTAEKIKFKNELK